jgi:glycosyltransferase involved in cell wall biosynthesis
VREAAPAARLAIAGDGPTRPAIEELVRHLRLDDCVHFLGVRNDVDSILAAADVCALSSDYEGMPLLAFESMAAGTPLVATAVGALPSVIENGRSGILVPPRDPHALAQALTGLLSDPARRAEIAAAAAERLAPYTIDAVTAEFAALYERLASEAGR